MSVPGSTRTRRPEKRRDCMSAESPSAAFFESPSTLDSSSTSACGGALYSAGMRVLYLTMNPNRQSTTVPTEGWFRELRPKGLEPVLVSNEIGSFHQWVAAQGIPAYHVPMPLPNDFSATRLIWPLWKLRGIVKRHRI